ncbi:MAG: lipopolysaccharide biosynthesis protein [Sedimenticola sp.]
MDEEIKGLSDYLGILSRRKKQLIFPIVIILLASVALALGLPSVYRSEATILIEQQEIPPDLVRSTVTSYAGERIQMISQRVMTTENLSKIIDNYGLYKDMRADTSIAMLVEEMREVVSLEMISADVVDPRSGRPTTATMAFKLSFSDKNPRVAQKVTSELVSLYLDENLRRRTKSAVETSGFLATEADKLEDQVSELEASLATFKEENINNLPELQQLNMQLMERTERDMKDTKQQIRTLEERKIYLQSELAQMSPNSTLYSADGKRVLGAEDRLKSLQSEYIALSSRYSATHPNVIKMGREIEALKKEAGITGDVTELTLQLKELKAERASISKRYSTSHPNTKKVQRAIDAAQAALDKAVKEKKGTEAVAEATRPDNPAYIQLQAQLEVAEGEIRSIKRSRVELKSKLDDFEQRLLKSPQVERKYRDLSRDYDQALAKYSEVKGKQLEAGLAEALERESKGERFSLIEPPQIPEKPAKPNRLAILFLGFILSLAGGVGTVAVAESMSETIKEPHSLISLTGMPPMIVIPYIEIAAERNRRRAWRWGLIFTILMVGIGTVAAFHFMVMPLDVAWFVIQRRLGFAS